MPRAGEPTLDDDKAGMDQRHRVLPRDAPARDDAAGPQGWAVQASVQRPSARGRNAWSAGTTAAVLNRSQGPVLSAGVFTWNR